MKLVRVDELFDVEYGNQFDLSKLEILGKGNINFVSRSSKNNGVVAKVLAYKKRTPYEAGLITVTLGGSYLLSAFVQEHIFYTAQNIKVLRPKENMSTEAKLFYCAAIAHNRFRYTSHGREANKTLESILLPHPDSLPSFINTQLPAKPSNKSYSGKKLSLSAKKQAFFMLADIFNINSSRDKVFMHYKKGLTPYIASTEKDNGVIGYVHSEPTNDSGNITINRGGSVGEAFYQSRKYVATPVDIRIMKRKDGRIINPYIGMFLCTIIKNEKYRFNYARKMGTDRLKNLAIKLPTNNNGNPDWQFMEDYIKSLPYSSNLKTNDMDTPQLPEAFEQLIDKASQPLTSND